MVVKYLKRPLLAAVDDASVDDAVAINEALECASTRVRGADVIFAPGRYLLRTPIRPRSDHLVLEGARGRDGSRATLVADPCNPEQFPGVIEVFDTPVTDLSIRGFRVELRNGPRLPPSDHRAASNSGIQLNHCSRCTVEQVDMEYTGGEPAECKPYNLDGITFALNSWGTIRRVRVRGVPKAGIYAASTAPGGPLLIEESEVLQSDGPLGATGISVVAPDVTVRRCRSHDNVLHPFPSRASSHEQGGGIFLTVQRGSGPVAGRSRVEDSSFEDNGGPGVLIGSPYLTSWPAGVTLVDVAARRNGGNGVRVEAGSDVLLSHVEVGANGYQGILITGVTNPPGPVRLGRITILDPVVYDNGAQRHFRADPAHPVILPGIGIIRAPSVEVVGGRFFRTTGAPSTQYVGVGVYPSAGMECADAGCVRLRGSALAQGGLLAPLPFGARMNFRLPLP